MLDVPKLNGDKRIIYNKDINNWNKVCKSLSNKTKFVPYIPGSTKVQQHFCSGQLLLPRWWLPLDVGRLRSWPGTVFLGSTKRKKSHVGRLWEAGRREGSVGRAQIFRHGYKKEKLRSWLSKLLECLFDRALKDVNFEVHHKLTSWGKIKVREVMFKEQRSS